MKTKQIAWNGISFSIPENWEISSYKFPGKNRTIIEIEDEYAVRLEAEWAVSTQERLDRIRKRYRETVGDMAKEADRAVEIEKIPKGWTASVYEFRETDAEHGRKGIDVSTHILGTALYDSPASGLFAYFIFRFHPEDREHPETLIRLVAETFTDHTGDKNRPWKLFDIDTEVPSIFTIDKTAFDVGAKMMRFRYKGRILWIWFFSCADVILKDAPGIEHWVTGYLNSYSGIKGKRFFPGSDGRISWKRRFPNLITSRDDLFRWCFRTQIRCRRDTKENRIVAWLYNYRSKSDLELLPEEFEFKS